MGDDTESGGAKDRDARFKEILRAQLGENGIALTVNLTVLFILSLVMIVVTMVAFNASLSAGGVDATGRGERRRQQQQQQRPVLVMPAVVKK